MGKTERLVRMLDEAVGARALDESLLQNARSELENHRKMAKSDRATIEALCERLAAAEDALKATARDSIALAEAERRADAASADYGALVKEASRLREQARRAVPEGWDVSIVARPGARVTHTAEGWQWEAWAHGLHREGVAATMADACKAADAAKEVTP